MGVADLIKKFESITKDIDHSAETVKKEGLVDDISDAISDYKINVPSVSAGNNTLETLSVVEANEMAEVASANDFAPVSTGSKEDAPYEEDRSLVNEGENSEQVKNNTFEAEHKDGEGEKDVETAAIECDNESFAENGKEDEEDKAQHQNEHEPAHEHEHENENEQEQEQEQENDQGDAQGQDQEQEYENEEHDQDENEIDNDLDNENEAENDNDAENDQDNDNELDQDKKDDSRKRSLKKKNSKKKNSKKKNSKKSAPGSKGAATEKLAAASGGVNTLRQA